VRKSRRKRKLVRDKVTRERETEGKEKHSIQ
jgi:hypothetical protein